VSGRPPLAVWLYGSQVATLNEGRGINLTWTEQTYERWGSIVPRTVDELSSALSNLDRSRYLTVVPAAISTVRDRLTTATRDLGSGLVTPGDIVRVVPSDQARDGGSAVVPGQLGGRPVQANRRRGPRRPR